MLKTLRRMNLSGWPCLLALVLHLLSPLSHGARHLHHAYDAANNRDTKTVTRISGTSSTEAGENDIGHWSYDYNSANQLTAWEKRDYPSGSVQKSATLTYDDAGNRTSQTVLTGGSGSTTSYSWDAQDRLASVTQRGTTNQEPTTYTYAYDYRTRRIGTHETSTASTKHTAIVFSGGLSVAEWESTTNLEPGTLNPSSPTVEYTRGPDMGGGVGGLLYTARSQSGTGLQPVLKYNPSNGRGDIVAQADSAAALTWTASYEAYGKRTKETGTNEDKQRANSKDEDPTGLLNEGFRYRDLETGVWLSRDPAGFVDGPNVYAYVQQNPWSKFDAKGLFWSALLTIASAAYDTYQYATGEMTGAEYARSMAVNGAALAADVVTGGMGGGMAVRAAALSCKAKTAIVGISKAIDKADTILSTVEAAAGAREALANGDGLGAAIQAGTALMSGKSAMTKTDVPSFCFAAGTQVQTQAGLQKIETLHVGQRVLADSSDAEHSTAVRAGDWRRVEFTFADPHTEDGKLCRVVLLRPAEHVASQGWREGGEVEIDFGPEVQRESGEARIVSITPAAEPEHGAGQVVTGTFQTWHRDLRELWMEGLAEPVRVTSGHRFYSASREAWIDAHHLQVGETVRTRDGAGCRVLAVKPLAGEHAVFNIEVETLHQYHVTPTGLLTHNNSPADCSVAGSARGVNRMNDDALDALGEGPEVGAMRISTDGHDVGTAEYPYKRNLRDSTSDGVKTRATDGEGVVRSEHTGAEIVEGNFSVDHHPVTFAELRQQAATEQWSKQKFDAAQNDMSNLKAARKREENVSHVFEDKE